MYEIEQRKRTKQRIRVADLARIALFVVLMYVGAKISIPLPNMPITFQTVIAVLAGLLLGAKYGATAVGIYLFMGLLGFPVFSKGGGFVYVFELTFGYLIGFVVAAWTTGMIAGPRRVHSLPRMILAAIAGFLVNYAIGIPYFICIWVFYLGNAGVGYAVLVYNILFIPKDLILSILAALVCDSVYRCLPTHRLGIYKNR